MVERDAVFEEHAGSDAHAPSLYDSGTPNDRRRPDRAHTVLVEQRLRPLSEEECYLRCYGWRGSDDTVKVVPAGRPSRHRSPAALTERIRLAFEARMEAREPEAA